MEQNGLIWVFLCSREGKSAVQIKLVLSDAKPVLRSQKAYHDMGLGQIAHAGMLHPHSNWKGRPRREGKGSRQGHTSSAPASTPLQCRRALTQGLFRRFLEGSFPHGRRGIPSCRPQKRPFRVVRQHPNEEWGRVYGTGLKTSGRDLAAARMGKGIKRMGGVLLTLPGEGRVVSRTLPVQNISGLELGSKIVFCRIFFEICQKSSQKLKS